MVCFQSIPDAKEEENQLSFINKKSIRPSLRRLRTSLEKVNNVDKSSVKIMYFGESMFKLQYYHQTQEVSKQVHRRRPLAHTGAVGQKI